MSAVLILGLLLAMASGAGLSLSLWRLATLRPTHPPVQPRHLTVIEGGRDEQRGAR